MFDDDRFKTVASFEELKTLVEEDKNMNGMGVATANRYPIRFVLFDNFKDSYEFANSTSKCKITKCFCKSTLLELKNSISFLVSH